MDSSDSCREYFTLNMKDEFLKEITLQIPPTLVTQIENVQNL